jgi:hypothetical protein
MNFHQTAIVRVYFLPHAHRAFKLGFAEIAKNRLQFPLLYGTL